MNYYKKLKIKIVNRYIYFHKWYSYFVKIQSSRIQIKQEKDFKFIIRLFNSNIDGKQKVAYALRRIRGLGRRISHIILQKAGIDLNKRGGELTEQDIEKILERVANPGSK